MANKSIVYKEREREREREQANKQANESSRVWDMIWYDFCVDESICAFVL